MKELKYNNQLVKVNDGTTGFDLLKILNIEGRSNVLVYKLNGEFLTLQLQLSKMVNFPL